jgi:hypothetical protein
MKPLDIVGPGEVRDMFGVTLETVSRWQAAGVLPVPDCRLVMGPVWRRSTIVAWANKTGRTLRYE